MSRFSRYLDVPYKYCYKSVCPEGHHNCLRLVRPAQVVEAVQTLLVETGRAAKNKVRKLQEGQANVRIYKRA